MRSGLKKVSRKSAPRSMVSDYRTIGGRPFFANERFFSRNNPMQSRFGGRMTMMTVILHRPGAAVRRLDDSVGPVGRNRFIAPLRSGWRNALRLLHPTRHEFLPRNPREKLPRPRMRLRAENPGRRALVADAAVLHEDDAVRGFAGEAHLVAHHHHGHAGGTEVAHHREHAAHELGIER